MLPKFLIEKTATGERTLVEGELPLRIAPPNGPGTYTVRSVSEQSSEVTITEDTTTTGEAPTTEEPTTGETTTGDTTTEAPADRDMSTETGSPPALAALSPPRLDVTAAVIGTALSATPGSWENATSVSGQWLRAGTPIAGAEGPDYTPVAEDDGQQLSYRETASDGTATLVQETGPVPVTYPAPSAKGGLHDEIFDWDSGPQIVETAYDFEGEGLRFEVSGAGATIEPETGRVTVPTDSVLEGEVVTVTARNSGGSAPSAFQVTIEDLDAEPMPNQVVAFTGKQEYQSSPPANWIGDRLSGVASSHSNTIRRARLWTA